MRQNGKRSTAALAVVSPVSSVSRLSAPVHMSDAERAIWLDLVNTEPSNAFTATHAPLLEAYCRHIVRGRILADEIENFERAWLANDEGLKRYDRLLAMAEREGRAASSLATRLRITRQATHDPKFVGRAARLQPNSKKPWELAESNES